MSKYPEHEKMHEARRQGSEEIGQFLEWLRIETKYTIGEWDSWKECHSQSIFTRGGQPEWRCINGRIMGGLDFDEDQGQCDDCDGTGRIERIEPRLMPASVSILKLLSMYFDIDQDKIEEEKRAMLNEIEEGNRAK